VGRHCRWLAPRLKLNSTARADDSQGTSGKRYRAHVDSRRNVRIDPHSTDIIARNYLAQDGIFMCDRMYSRSTLASNGLTEYQDAWKRYRRFRVLWLIISLMEFGPTEVVVAGIFPGVVPATRDFVQIFVSFSILFLIDSKMRDWRCPRCRRSFFHRRWADPPPALVIFASAMSFSADFRSMRRTNWR